MKIFKVAKDGTGWLLLDDGHEKVAALDQKIRSMFPQSPALNYDIGRGRVRGLNTLTIHNIGVDESFRGQGQAAKFLKELTSQADQLGVTLDLEVGIDEAEIDLVGWYRRHGFDFDGNHGYMIRYPRISTL